MDGSCKHAANAMTAMVVRQFTSSRIERQLLAQVFELICAPQCALDTSRSATQAAAGIQSMRHDEHRIEAHSARRHAA
jgi:hypothetical protein